MVFGNMGADSGTGVAFTRNPATGEPGVYGEFLRNAQGEDVVAGRRTPQDIAVLCNEQPELYTQLEQVARQLESHYLDMQDMEFTIEQGKLHMLQTRTGKRTAQAAVRIAVDMVRQGLIGKKEAVLQVDANQLPQALLPRFDANCLNTKAHPCLGTGLGASPGAASGRIVFDADKAVTLAQSGEAVILVRPETVPDDIHGMIAARGILTSRGGSTSHAAVVARGMGKPCVAGCEAARIDLKQETLTLGGMIFHEGDLLSIDGATGAIYQGAVPTVPPETQGELDTLMQWADSYRIIGVRANTDTPEDARLARSLGAQGIGLCRTEHMFMAQDRLALMQQMILAQDKEEREAALAALLPLQKIDFIGIFEAMEGYPVTIRLLDPPLHEFLPQEEAAQKTLAEMKRRKAPLQERKQQERLIARIAQLKESNPMLGFRGCRLGIVYPEIYRMQTQAIFEAAIEVSRQGHMVLPEVMLPLVSSAEELKRLREQLEALACSIMEQTQHEIPYQFGTMIEVPRAALTADEIAKHADFFSFGTNDLTQMTYGFSRDDAESKFLSEYLNLNILPVNPFEVLDRSGVGQLMRIARDQSRNSHPQLKLGVCGEHGGEAQSVAFCHQVGLNYVSCSPFRVPAARVAGAQAALRDEQEKPVQTRSADPVSISI